MRALALAVFVVASIGFFGKAVQAANVHDHASMHVTHEALPIPAGWTDLQVLEFIANSDALIDKAAGRSVTPGETIWSEGLPFTKSVPNMTVAQKRNARGVRNGRCVTTTDRAAPLGTVTTRAPGRVSLSEGGLEKCGLI